MDVILTWAGPVAAILSIGTLVYTFLTAGSAANGERIERLESTVIDHDRRIQSLESEFGHLPNKDTVVNMMLAMEQLKGTVAVLSENVGSIGRTVHRIDDYLRKKDGPE